MSQSILTSLALDDWFEAYQPQATSQSPDSSKSHPHPLRSHSKDLKCFPKPEDQPEIPGLSLASSLRDDDAVHGTTITSMTDIDNNPPPRYHDRGRSKVSRHNNTVPSSTRDFPEVPTRPPLRPSTSYGGSSMSSYYSFASTELEKKSMRVAAQEIFDDQQRKPSKRRLYCCCAALCLLNLMAGLNATSLVSALPTMSTDLDAGLVSTFWIANASLLTATLLQPLFMRLSTVGSKSLLVVGLTSVTIGSVLSALAKTTLTVIVGRSIEGCGSAAVRVLTQLILGQLITNNISQSCEKWIPVSFWLGTAIGPIIGGVFTQTVGWRYIFYINLPLAVVGGITVPLLVTLRGPTEPMWQRLKKIDVLGWILLSASCTLIILAISWAGSVQPWSSWLVIVPLLVGITLLATLAVYTCYSNNPILPVSCFTRAAAILPCIGTTVHGMLFTAILYMVAIYFQAGLSSTAQHSGTYLLSWTVSFVVIAIAASFAVPHSQNHLASGLGWGVATTGFTLTLLLTSHTSVVLAVPIGVLTGAALGLLAPLLRTSIQRAAATDDETIHAGPVHSFFSTVGMCLGLAVASSAYLNKRTQGQDVLSSLNSVWIVLTVLSSTAFVLCILSTVRVHKTPGLIELRFVSA